MKRQVLMSWGTQLLLHAFATLGVAVAVAALTMNTLAFEALSVSLDPQLADHGTIGIATHLGLSACVWVMFFLLYRAVSGSRKKARIVRVARGSAMTETLIVLPFLLLLISGLSQLTLLNVAGLLSNLAGYNAGRAVWVWDAQGASTAECQRRAIDGAAHAVAPSVPNNFVGAAGNRSGDASSLNYAAAYDTGSVAARADGKLAFAQQAVSVRVIRGGQVGADMTYRFHIAFPWFNYMFGDPAIVAGRRGYYAFINRRYELPRQP